MKAGGVSVAAVALLLFGSMLSGHGTGVVNVWAAYAETPPPLQFDSTWNSYATFCVSPLSAYEFVARPGTVFHVGSETAFHRRS